jgi:cell wall-associated NlpC family hydrolase
MASTHIRITGLMVSLLAVCLCVPVAAKTVQEDEQVRLASPDEGEAIVQAAWELRRGLGPKPDCSHFVQAVYARAGFDYEYANSWELFDGIDSFQRVQKPQPGDLIVWQGHMGIVIDPVEHSFYSSVLSGFAIEDYLSDYWLRRGRPRFYRYLVDNTVPRAGTLAHRDAKQDAPALNEQPVLTGRATSKHDPDLPVSTASGLPAGNTTGTPAPSDAATFDVIFVSRARPTKDEVLAAIVRRADAAGERLARGTSLDSKPSVAVADQFKVIELEVSDRSGWVEVEVKQAASIQYGFADPRPSTSKWRATLRRERQGWVLLAPQDRIYIRRDLAIQALANHLAVLSRIPANSQEVRRVVRVLDELSAGKSTYGAAGFQ